MYIYLFLYYFFFFWISQFKILISPIASNNYNNRACTRFESPNLEALASTTLIKSDINPSEDRSSPNFLLTIQRMACLASLGILFSVDWEGRMLPAESLTVFPEVPNYMIMWFHSFLLRSYFTRIQRKVLQHLKYLFLSIVLSQRLPESSAYVSLFTPRNCFFPFSLITLRYFY